MVDVIIVGGGPAGLNAALVLGRSRRTVLLFDTGQPRNAKSGGMHGYLSRDGILPSEFLSIARKEVERYGLSILSEEVTAVRQQGSTFVVRSASGQDHESRKILLATGLIDVLPVVQGLEVFYGSSIFHCPYCDGWEIRDQPTAVWGKGRNGAALALSLTTWSKDVMLFTNGSSALQRADKLVLASHHVEVKTSKILRLEGTGRQLERVVLEGEPAVPRRAMFISFGYVQHSSLAQQLGCSFTRKGVIGTDKHQETNVPGVFVAGDAARDMQMVVVAAAEGAKAGVAINMAIQRESPMRR